MSSFTENLYLKRQLQKLLEENEQLKQTINEFVAPPPEVLAKMEKQNKEKELALQKREKEQAMKDAEERIKERKNVPLDQMSPEESIQHGQDHFLLQGTGKVITPAHYHNDHFFSQGFKKGWTPKKYPAPRVMF